MEAAQYVAQYEDIDMTDADNLPWPRTPIPPTPNVVTRRAAQLLKERGVSEAWRTPLHPMTKYNPLPAEYAALLDRHFHTNLGSRPAALGF